jgi:aryl-alcohol dehydrogenase-like predicted oxidoreductase
MTTSVNTNKAYVVRRRSATTVLLLREMHHSNNVVVNKVKMRVPRRNLPRSNPNLPQDVPIIGLGCSSFSHFFWTKEGLEQAGGESQWTPETIQQSHPRVQEWIQTIHCAIQDYGITLLDTAPWYGHGTSEVVMGWAFEDLFRVKPDARATLIINTKVGRYEKDPSRQFDFSYGATMTSVELSLRRMNCGYIDVLQLHDPEFSPTLTILLDETIPAMIECQEKGWCKALGLTGYPLEVQYQILQAAHEKYGKPVFDQALTYCHYNLHDTSLFTRRIDKSGSFADFVSSQNMILMSAAPLSMGLLTHSGPPEWHPASDKLKEACRKAAEICERQGVNISTLAIVMALSNPAIPCTLLGMKDSSQTKLAAETAVRFASVSEEGMDPSSILKLILSEAEYKALQLLQDHTSGPFAEAWKSGDFRWDGVKDALDFWTQVEGAAIEKWQSPLR